MQIPGCLSMCPRRRRLYLPRVLPALGILFVAGAMFPSLVSAAAPLSGPPPLTLSLVDPPDRVQPYYYYLYYAGSVDYAAGRYPQAIQAFTQFINNADTSDLRDVFLYLGVSYNENEQYAQAIPAFTTHMLSHPEDTTEYALEGRGFAYLKLKNYDAAVADYEAYLLVNPKDSQMWNRYVDTSRSGKSLPPSRAIEVSVGALVEDPSNVSIREQLAAKKMEAKDFVAAIVDYNAILAAKPDDPDLIEACKNWGITSFNLQERNNAEADLMHYNLAKTGDKDVHNFIAQIIQDYGGDDAVAALLAIVKQAPGITDPNAWFNLGIAYRSQKKYKDALAAFSKSIALRQDPETLFERALTYFSIGKGGGDDAYALAESDCTAALTLKPDYADALLLKANSENAESKVVAGANDYFKYLSLPGESTSNQQYAMQEALKLCDAHKDLFSVYRMGSGSNADIPELLKYSRSKPDDAMGFYNLGVAYLAKADYLNAAECFEKAAGLAPYMCEAALLAATSYSSLADANRTDAAKATPFFDKAISFYDRASRLAPVVEHLRANTLYNEAATLEAKAKALDDVDPLKIAVIVWGKWELLSPHDSGFETMQKHVSDLMDKIEREE